LNAAQAADVAVIHGDLGHCSDSTVTRENLASRSSTRGASRRFSLISLSTPQIEKASTCVLASQFFGAQEGTRTPTELPAST
jgi:hypothetical protein